ncbi:MAG TPA: thioredoxin family protein [Bacilli bacterium]
MEQVQEEQAFNEAITGQKPTVALFKTTWCKDCHYLDVFLPQILLKYAEQIHFVEVDRDELMDVCEKYNVLGIPSFIAFTAGREILRFVSKLRKTQAEVELFLDRVIEVSKALAK